MSNPLTLPLLATAAAGYYLWWRKPPARPDRNKVVVDLRVGDELLDGPTTVEIEPARPTTFSLERDDRPLSVVLTPKELVQEGVYTYAAQDPFAFTVAASYNDDSGNPVQFTADGVLMPPTDNVASAIAIKLDDDTTLTISAQ